MKDSNHPLPIIVGVARSGTTLLRLMLDSHSELAIAHESGFVPAALNLIDPRRRAFYQRMRNSASRGNWKNGLREEFCRVVTGAPNWNQFQIPAADFRLAVSQLESFTVSEGIRTFYRMYAARFDKPRGGDKVPYYLRHMKAIARALPEARFVHIIRDGRDVAVSLRDLPFAPGRGMETLANLWVTRILSARKQARSLPHYYELKYEDLLENTDDVLKGVCEFVALSYQEGMKQYYLHAKERMSELDTATKPEGGDRMPGSEIHPFTSQPPERSRIGRWKTELTPDEIRAFEKVGGELLEELGYRPYDKL